MAKIKYRRRDKSDTWHWCTNCPNWPREKPYEEIEIEEGKRPSYGELDNTCRAKERDGDCRKA